MKKYIIYFFQSFIIYLLFILSKIIDEYHGFVKLPSYKRRPDLVDFAALRVDLVDLAALLAEAGVAAVLVRF